MQLSGRTALITGASSGIGRATAVALAREGAAPVLVSRRKPALMELAGSIRKEHDVRVHVVTADVGEEEQVRQAVDEAVDEMGGLDIVVNNAGINIVDTDLEHVSTTIYRNMMRVNVDGTFFIVRETLPYLRQANGNLIVIGSYAGQHPIPASPIYAATKWWTRGFVHSVAGAVGDANVAVSLINPSKVRTNMGSERNASLKQRYKRGEIIEPEEVAEAVVFAARQSIPTTVHELDLYNRDKLSNV